MADASQLELTEIRAVRLSKTAAVRSNCPIQAALSDDGHSSQRPA